MGFFSKNQNVKSGNYDIYSEQEITGATTYGANPVFSAPSPASSAAFQPQKSTISLKCDNCGATMEIDRNKSVMFCPYCGSKNIIPLSDNVQIQKMKVEAYRDIELTRQQTMLQLEKQRRENQASREKTDLKKFLLSQIISFIGIAVLILFLILILPVLFSIIL